MSIDVGAYDGDDSRSEQTGRVTLGTIQLSILRMEGNINGLRTDINYMREAQLNQFAEVWRRFNDQEARLRAIEAKRVVETSGVWKAGAALLTVGSILVAIIAVLVK